MVSIELAKLDVGSNLTIAILFCDSSNGRTSVLHTGSMVQFPFTAFSIKRIYWGHGEVSRKGDESGEDINLINKRLRQS